MTIDDLQKLCAGGSSEVSGIVDRSPDSITGFSYNRNGAKVRGFRVALRAIMPDGHSIDAYIVERVVGNEPAHFVVCDMGDAIAYVSDLGALLDQQTVATMGAAAGLWAGYHDDDLGLSLGHRGAIDNAGQLADLLLRYIQLRAAAHAVYQETRR